MLFTGIRMPMAEPTMMSIKFPRCCLVLCGVTMCLIVLYCPVRWHGGELGLLCSMLSCSPLSDSVVNSSMFLRTVKSSTVPAHDVYSWEILSIISNTGFSSFRMLYLFLNDCSSALARASSCSYMVLSLIILTVLTNPLPPDGFP